MCIRDRSVITDLGVGFCRHFVCVCDNRTWAWDSADKSVQLFTVNNVEASWACQVAPKRDRRLSYCRSLTLVHVNPFTAMMSLENNQQKWNHYAFLSSFLHRKGFSSKRIISIESRCVIRTGKYTVCRHLRASISPEILRAAAVKGLKEPVFLLRTEHVSNLSPADP